MDTINYFMWGYQRLFLSSITFSAERLFEELDPDLKPNIFLLGVLIEPVEERHPICIEPEDGEFSVDLFKNVLQLSQGLENVHPRKRIFQSHPIAQERSERFVYYSSIQKAIYETLKSKDFFDEKEFFVSYPTKVEGYLVFVVLEISKETLAKYYSLTKDKFDGRFEMSKSFLYSAIKVFLESCSRALERNNPGEELSVIERRIGDLLNEAGQNFMITFAQTGDNFNGLDGLYEACNTISSLRYEGREGLGKLVIAKKNHPNIKMILELDQPINIRNFRKIRKFLELSDDKTLIISDSYMIYGLGEIIGKYNPREESLFVINFTQYYQWEALHDNNVLMKVAYRQPSLPKERVSKNLFSSNLQRIFNEITNNQINDLWELTNEVAKQSHGTILVITDNAKKEAKRLSNQSFGVKPLKLTNNIAQQITAIDGAVLVDRNSVCYAIGVILDGIASEKGDSSRGARYNSAIRYIEYCGKKKPTFLILISEDGMIDLVPNLRPQIKRSLIKEHIEKLREMKEAENVEYKDFNEVINFFEKVEFYLSNEECLEINKLREEVDKNIDVNIRIVRKDLKPNPEMNDSYFIKE